MPRQEVIPEVQLFWPAGRMRSSLHCLHLNKLLNPHNHINFHTKLPRYRVKMLKMYFKAVMISLSKMLSVTRILKNKKA